MTLIQKILATFGAMVVALLLAFLFLAFIGWSTGQKFGLREGDILCYKNEGRSAKPGGNDPMVALYVVEEITSESVKVSGWECWDSEASQSRVVRWYYRSYVDTWSFEVIGHKDARKLSGAEWTPSFKIYYPSLKK